MEEIIFTRKELYDLVWSEPISRLAKKYNMSNNGIKKRCIKMHIPVPPVGYWSRIKHGYKMKRPELSTKYKGENETTLCYRDKDGQYIEKLNKVSPVTELKHKIQNDPTIKVTVPDEITRLDDLVSQAKKSLLKNFSRVQNYVGMHTTKYGELNILISEPNIDRALRFMNALIKLLRSRNHNVIIENYKTCAIVFGEKLKIKLKEKAKIVYNVDEFGHKVRELHPSGIIAFVHEEGSYRQREWTDGKKPIESKLAEILAYLEIYAKNEIERRIEWEKRKKIEDEERKRQKELQRKKDEEIGKIKILINNANYWKQSQILREFLSAIENSKELDHNKMEWIPWAKQKIEWLDPFTQKEDNLLNDKDRENLMNELNDLKTIKLSSLW